MEDTASLRPWLKFAALVLVVGVLYAAQRVIVPVALAALFTFVLASPVNWLERRIGNVAAVLTTAVVVFALLGLATWGLARQINYLADDLPIYRKNVLSKVADIRGVGKGGSVEKIQKTLDEIKSGLEQQPGKTPAPRPLIVSPVDTPAFAGLEWLGPALGPLGTAALVITLVIFMLLERHSLRDRLIGLVGNGQMARTTRALDEAGARVSRQLLMQTLVNLVYGVCSGVGLHFLGVPYALVWAAMGAALRYIPYVGPILGAGTPILISLAALEGWADTLRVAIFFAVLELFTNLVLETILYAGAAGVSQVALLISVAFWTWLWGPLGLLMAIPLTVCLVVIGKHVPGLDVIGTLLADAPALAPESAYYQRLLARDVGEAADLIDRYVKTQEPRSVYDAVLLPALNYAERDRLEGRISSEEEHAIVETISELLADAAGAIARQEGTAPAPVAGSALRVLGCGMNDSTDEIALRMMGDLMNDTPLTLSTVAGSRTTSELLSQIQTLKVSVVCLADLPPSSASKTRYLVKRLHAALPSLKIAVGRWAVPGFEDDTAQGLRTAGADIVCSTLSEMRTYLLTLAQTEIAAEGEHAA